MTARSSTTRSSITHLQRHRRRYHEGYLAGVIVDGNLDNVDADRCGMPRRLLPPRKKRRAKHPSTAGRDWVRIFNIKRIEEAVKKGEDFGRK
jgi:hypothetical protein